MERGDGERASDSKASSVQNINKMIVTGVPFLHTSLVPSKWLPQLPTPTCWLESPAEGQSTTLPWEGPPSDNPLADEHGFP